MAELERLLNLPLPTLAALAAGYIGYRIAFVGRDGPHGPADVVFLSFAFAAVAQGVMSLAPVAVWAGAPLAVAATLIGAVSWRVIGDSGTLYIMRRLRISGHDRGRTAWESMLMRDLKAPNRVVVTLKSGRQIMCANTNAFHDAPLGPCLFGPDGSVALYVTDTRPNPEADWVELQPHDPENPKWGWEMTLIPADTIERVKVTRPR